MQILGTADTSSSTTGSLTVAGGAGFGKSVSVGTSLFVQSGSWTSTGTDLYINSGGSNVNIRTTAGSNSGEFESDLTDFNFRTANVTVPDVIAPYRAFTIDKTTGYVFVRNTDDTTGNATGSFQVFGGQTVSKSVWIGSNATVQGNLAVTGTVAFSNTTNSTSITTGSVAIAAVSV